MIETIKSLEIKGKHRLLWFIIGFICGWIFFYINLISTLKKSFP